MAQVAQIQQRLQLLSLGELAIFRRWFLRVDCGNWHRWFAGYPAPAMIVAATTEPQADNAVVSAEGKANAPAVAPHRAGNSGIDVDRVGLIQRQGEALSGAEWEALSQWFAQFDTATWYQWFAEHATGGKLKTLADEVMRGDETERCQYGRYNQIGTLRFHDGWLRLPSSIKYVLINSDHLSRSCKRCGGLAATRIGRHYCALAVETADALRWFWIGRIAEYDRLLDGNAVSEHEARAPWRDTPE